MTKNEKAEKADRVITRESVVGTCPGCSAPINATTTIKVHLGAPTFDDGGNIEVAATSELSKVVIPRHVCDGSATPEPEPQP